MPVKLDPVRLSRGSSYWRMCGWHGHLAQRRHSGIASGHFYEVMWQTQCHKPSHSSTISTIWGSFYIPFLDISRGMVYSWVYGLPYWQGCSTTLMNQWWWVAAFPCCANLVEPIWPVCVHEEKSNYIQRCYRFPIHFVTRVMGSSANWDILRGWFVRAILYRFNSRWNRTKRAKKTTRLQ